VAKEDLEYLSERVKKLRDLTELACKEKKESLLGLFRKSLPGILF